MPKVISTRTVTIDQTDGATARAITSEIDLAGYFLTGIGMPSGWTAANLTFKSAPATGGTFQNVYDDAGTEITVTAAASENLSLLTATKLLNAYRYVKIRSGTGATPVTQEVARTLTLYLQDAP